MSWSSSIRIVVWVLAACAVCGCADSDPWSGIWRNSGAPVNWTSLGFNGDMELAVSVYGDDAAGVVRLFEAGKDYDENWFFDKEPCLYLDSGDADAGHLDFTLRTSSSGDWIALCTLKEGQTFELLLEEKDGAGQFGPFLFERYAEEDQIEEQGLDQGCPSP